MTNPGAIPTARAAPCGDSAPPPEEALVHAFNALRDELVSTLMFVVGNRDDAQDAAQEAFLKCWRARAGLPAVLNLRAWIFRVGLNAARDLQRSAWHRKARPLLGDAAMLTDRSAPPGQL